MTDPMTRPDARRRSRRAALLAATAAIGLCAAPAFAQSAGCDDPSVPLPPGCKRDNAGVTLRMPIGENTERVQSAPAGDLAADGFSISLDDPAAAGSPDTQRATDRALQAADLQIKFDGLGATPRLNVSTTDLRASYRAGDPVRFRASTNYPAYIARAEVLILDKDARGEPVVDRVTIPANGEAAWQMPVGGSGRYAYALRVYDAAGRYDETEPLDPSRSTAAFPAQPTVGGPVIAAGEGDDRTAIRKIPISGGAVTAYGTGVPGSVVEVMGEPVPVDGAGAFVVQRILPPGRQTVDIRTADGPGLSREVEIPQNEWFYVAIADATLGRKIRDDLEEASDGYEKTYLDGRAAYYLKGRIKGRTLITSSLDSGEGPLEDVFKRLDEKDPRRVLQRLDPNDYYPVYGDDSAAFDDTPTSGRFYIRVERDASYALFGDFKADVTGARLLENRRSLFGAKLHYQTPAVTDKGDACATVTAYAAQPDTLPQRDVLRGTGGSAYFLSRQDINAGSETLLVEVRDRVSGRILSSRRLVEGQDYDIDYVQGVVILRMPLNSVTGGTGVVRDGALGDRDVSLVAQYEYTPTVGTIDGASLGGRVETWVGDKLRLGFTGMSETTGEADQTMAGTDLHFDFGSASFIEAEVAHTDGPGFGRAYSTDGGLTITPSGISGGGSGSAYTLTSEVALADLGLAASGVLGFYIEQKDAGFSTIAEDITRDQTLVGAYGAFDLNDRTTLRLKAEDFRATGGDRKGDAVVELGYRLSDRWLIEGGLAWTDRLEQTNPAETGTRTDVGTKLTYAVSDDLSVYGFGQVTAQKSGTIQNNDRLGFGLAARLSDKITLEGELSDGDQGIGADARVGYSPTANNELYLGYTLDPAREGAGYDLVGRDRGKLVYGARYRYSETLTTFGENTYDLFGERRSLTHAYGVNYTPAPRWTLTGGLESGEVTDSINGNFDRVAYSFGMTYADETQLKGRLRLEYRTENGAGTAQDRDTWLIASGLEYKYTEDWRLLLNLDALISDSSESAFRDGQYVEASLGAAYRPVTNDRINALFKYSYLRDLPGPDQVTVNGATDGPSQKSHVFSVDVNYDLTERLTLGGKYGYRRSEVAPRGTDAYTNSTAHLAILRADWHVVHLWDLMAEGRMLYTEQTSVTEDGALLGVYRHFGNNAKVGVGYEWGKVSDDLTDLDYKSTGIFLNLIADF